MPDVFTGMVACLLGSMVLGVALTLLGAAWLWAARMRRPGAARQLGRGALGASAAALLLVGLVLATHGIESLLGNPLGRWSGGSMVLDLWIALEVMTRDLALTAALSERRALWTLPAVSWIATKAAMVLTAFVALWAWLGA